MKLVCLIWAHRWHKWGGTRVGDGLFRQCDRCQRLEQGFENGRAIAWQRAALARCKGAQS